MTFLLSSKNVFEYLSEKGLHDDRKSPGQVELKPAKNFNLLLSLVDGRKLLVKQERYDQDGKTCGEFLSEWRIQEFLQQFPELSSMRSWLPEVLHFDADNSIIVFKYLDDFQDVADFYTTKENTFPVAIATSIGAMLAAIHHPTLDRQEYRNFFSQKSEDTAVNHASVLARGLERIGPEVFGQVPPDGLKFFALYQRYDSLGKAIAELGNAIEPCCVTHNDLKLNNILVSLDWEQEVSIVVPASSSIVRLRLIDWERSTWGDPAFDLGSIIASYLGIWLGSLVVSKSVGIEEALRLAITPLELLQPSLTALVRSYFAHFPEILERRPNFLHRALQFSGLCLIQNIQSMLQYQKVFGNTGVCMLQVAKTLLCRPEASTSTVFGVEKTELTRRIYSPT